MVAAVGECEHGHGGGAQAELQQEEGGPVRLGVRHQHGQAEADAVPEAQPVLRARLERRAVAQARRQLQRHRHVGAREQQQQQAAARARHGCAAVVGGAGRGEQHEEVEQLRHAHAVAPVLGPAQEVPAGEAAAVVEREEHARAEAAQADAVGGGDAEPHRAGGALLRGARAAVGRARRRLLEPEQQRVVRSQRARRQHMAGVVERHGDGGRLVAGLVGLPLVRAPPQLRHLELLRADAPLELLVGVDEHELQRGEVDEEEPLLLLLLRLAALHLAPVHAVLNRRPGLHRRPGLRLLRLRLGAAALGEVLLHVEVDHHLRLVGLTTALAASTTAALEATTRGVALHARVECGGRHGGAEAAEGHELLRQLLRDDAHVGALVRGLALVAEDARHDLEQRLAAEAEVAEHVLDARVGEHAPLARATQLPRLAVHAEVVHDAQPVDHQLARARHHVRRHDGTLRELADLADLRLGGGRGAARVPVVARAW
mmetsp:Transcript_2984/g.7763  ORF Transcript_2984/g.7763 Transcript_2984/m.7763 type:complete len:487 (+) Transcript_2984:471-1931(+)